MNKKELRELLKGYLEKDSEEKDLKESRIVPGIIEKIHFHETRVFGSEMEGWLKKRDS